MYVSDACLFDSNKALISGANTKEKYSHTNTNTNTDTNTNTNTDNLKDRRRNEQRKG